MIPHPTRGRRGRRRGPLHKEKEKATVEKKKVASKVSLQELELALDEIVDVLKRKKPVSDATKAA